MTQLVRFSFAEATSDGPKKKFFCPVSAGVVEFLASGSIVWVSVCVCEVSSGPHQA